MNRVELGSKFNPSSDDRSELNRVDATKIVIGLRSAYNLNSVQAWSSLVQPSRSSHQYCNISQMMISTL